jgi:hypothetical protein
LYLLTASLSSLIAVLASALVLPSYAGHELQLALARALAGVGSSSSRYASHLLVLPQEVARYCHPPGWRAEGAADEEEGEGEGQGDTQAEGPGQQQQQQQQQHAGTSEGHRTAGVAQAVAPDQTCQPPSSIGQSQADGPAAAAAAGPQLDQRVHSEGAAVANSQTASNIDRVQAGAGGQVLAPQAEPLLGYSVLRVHVVRPAGPSEQEAAGGSSRDDGSAGGSGAATGDGSAAPLASLVAAAAGLSAVPAAADAAVELIDLSEPPDEVFLQLLRWSSEATVKRQKLLARLPT